MVVRGVVDRIEGEDHCFAEDEGIVLHWQGFYRMFKKMTSFVLM